MSDHSDADAKQEGSPLDESQCMLYARAADEINSSLDADADIESLLAASPDHAEQIEELLPAVQALRTLKQDYLTRDDPNSANSGDNLPRVLGDYQIRREIGHGGMGVVYEAQQISLQRRVALKVLPFAAMLDRRQLQRFKTEAHAAAMLHHSNIVPVYGVGCERGVHYYAMQFIEGRTLGQLVDTLRIAESKHSARQDADVSGSSKSAPQLDAPQDELQRTLPLGQTAAFAAPGNGTSDSSAETLRLEQAGISTDQGTKCAEYYRSIVEIVIQVAEALDHAHQEGVIHRDVKPSNLILDVSGKIWVTDFGLARVESDQGLTRTGDLIGTLRYMSPEQVLAKQVIVDQRTDIYSLGVTLYELLTLQVAFQGDNRQELLRRIAFEEPRRPRRVCRAIPAELETIVLKAMAKNPSERYTTMARMAEDLGCHLENRPIQAKRPSIPQRAAKWSRRHKSIVVSATFTFLLAVVGLAISAGLLWNEKANTQRAYDEARSNYEDANAQRRLASQRAEQAVRAAAEAKAVLNFVVHGLLSGARPENTKGRSVTVEDVLKNAEHKIEGAFHDQPLIEASVRHMMGTTYLHLGRFVAAERHLNRSRTLRAAHLGEDHPETLIAINDLGLALNSQSKFDEARRLHEKTFGIRRRLLGEEHISTLNSKSNLANVLLALGHSEESRRMHAGILVVRRRVFGPEHADTIESMKNLAVSLKFLGRREECREMYAKVLAIYQRLHGDEHPLTLAGMNNLGCALRLQGHWGKAAEIHQQALDGQLRVLGEQHPQTLISMNNLALAKHLQGDRDGAIELLQRALRGQRKILGTEHRETLCSMGNLVNLYREQLRLDEALALGKQVLEVQQRVLGKEHAETLTSMNNLALVFSKSGEPQRAMRLHEQTLQIRRRVLGQEHPETLVTMHNLASVKRQLGMLDKALDLYDRTLFIQRKVLGPDHPKTLRTSNAAANVLRSQKRLDEARWRYEETIKLQRERLGDDAPDTLRTRHNLALLLDEMRQTAEARRRYELILSTRRELLGSSHVDTLYSIRSLAVLLQRNREFNAAEDLFQEALLVQKQRRALHPDNVSMAVQYANGCWDLGRLLLDMKELQRADQAFTDSLQAFPAKPLEVRQRPAVRRSLQRSHARRAITRRLLGRLKAAWQDEDAWLSMQEPKAAAHNFLAWIVVVRPGSTPADLQRAIHFAETAVELEPTKGAFLFTLGVAHYRLGSWSDAIDALEASIQLRDGGDAHDWYFLAMSHQQNGSRKEALQWLQRADEWLGKQKNVTKQLVAIRAEAKSLLSRSTDN